MTLLAYCIVPSAAAPPDGLQGVGGADVRLLDAGAGLGLWYSQLPARPPADVDTLRVHNRTIAAAMDHSVTPVPLRFGQWFAGADEARAALQDGADRWTALLRRFAGRAEYGVRVSRQPGAATSVPHAATDPARDVHQPERESGSAYMAAVAERYATAGRLVADVQSAAGSIIAEQRHQTLRGDPDVATMAHLVAWSDADTYHACMQNIRRKYGSLDFLFTGPWPPYSFVDEG